MTILVADDDRSIAQLLSTFLKAEGFHVVVAYDVMQAMAAIVRSAPDVILLDIMMPGGSGLQLLQRVKASTKTSLVPVLVMSASSDPKLPKVAKECGAEEFIPKPLNLEHLYQTLCRLVGKPAVPEAADAEDKATRHLPLWERAAIAEVLRRELGRAARQKTPVAVLLVRIDPLGRIRENQGTEAAEAVVRHVAARISASVRLYDSIGRHGSNDLLVVLPGSGIEGAVKRGERIREVAATSTRRDGEKPLTVRLSIGAASAPQGGETVSDSLIRSAEAALDQAVAAGGNRVHAAAVTAAVNNEE